MRIHGLTVASLSVADPEMLTGQKTINVAIANAHNELYAFYTGKGDLLKKVLRPMGKGGRPYRPRLLNPPLLIVSTIVSKAMLEV